MAKEKVYLVLEKETKGPFSVKDVNEFLVSKKITHKNLAWIKGIKEWISLDNEYFQDVGIITPEILENSLGMPPDYNKRNLLSPQEMNEDEPSLSELANSFVSTFVKKTKIAVESFSADSLVDDLKNRTKGMSFFQRKTGILVESGGQRIGPLGIIEINNKLKAGDIQFSDLAWIEGMNDWKALSDSYFSELGVGRIATEIEEDGNEEAVILGELANSYLDDEPQTESFWKSIRLNVGKFLNDPPKLIPAPLAQGTSLSKVSELGFSLFCKINSVSLVLKGEMTSPEVLLMVDGKSVVVDSIVEEGLVGNLSHAGRVLCALYFAALTDDFTLDKKEKLALLTVSRFLQLDDDQVKQIPSVAYQLLVDFLSENGSFCSEDYERLLSVKESLSIQENNPVFVSFIKKSAESGLSESQFKLFQLYSKGIGTEKNGKLAEDWLNLSFQNGYPEAIQFIADRDGKTRWGNLKWEGEKPNNLAYLNGKLFTGCAEEYDQEGQISFVENYKDGQKHGLTTVFHESTHKKLEENYKEGKKDGPSTEWDKNGKVVRELYFKEGNPVKIDSIKEQGTEELRADKEKESSHNHTSFGPDQLSQSKDINEPPKEAYSNISPTSDSTNWSSEEREKQLAFLDSQLQNFYQNISKPLDQLLAEIKSNDFKHSLDKLKSGLIDEDSYKLINENLLNLTNLGQENKTQIELFNQYTKAASSASSEETFYLTILACIEYLVNVLLRPILTIPHVLRPIIAHIKSKEEVEQLTLEVLRATVDARIVRGHLEIILRDEKQFGEQMAKFGLYTSELAELKQSLEETVSLVLSPQPLGKYPSKTFEEGHNFFTTFTESFPPEFGEIIFNYLKAKDLGINMPLAQPESPIHSRGFCYWAKQSVLWLSMFGELMKKNSPAEDSQQLPSREKVGVAEEIEKKSELPESNEKDSQSIFELGKRYAEGDGVRQSWAEAVKWYQKAADQGNADAQYNLGFCYANGDGVRQNWAEAVKWYNRSKLNKYIS